MELKAALEKQELGSRLLSLTNNVPGMVYRGHRDWSLSFIGAEVEPVTGYSAEELTSGAARWKEIIHPDDMACVKESYRKAVKERLKFLRVEYRIRRKNGDIRWVADRRQLMYDETGSFDYVDGLLLDITERKETDRRLAESEYRFRTIADLAVNGMLTADSRGNIDFFNPAAERLFGYASEEVIGKHVTMLISERYRNAHKAGMERFLKTWETQVVGRTVELNALRKDGTEFPIELSLGTWGPREAPLFSAIVRDITERKRVEEEQQIFVSLVENSTDLIGIASLDGKVFYLNQAGQKLTGLDGLEEVRRTRIQDYSMEKDSDTLDKMLGSLHKKGTWTGEASIRHFKTGTLVPIEMHAFVIKAAKTGHPIALANISRDISERKKLDGRWRRPINWNRSGSWRGGSPTTSTTS